jgi:8-oxo-dGTP pyrophosphatase MutT (NUDIX family)
MGGTGSKTTARAVVTKPIPAAAVILLAPFKENMPGFRIAMVKRASTMKFMPDCYVFPGGKIDEADRKLALDPEEVPDIYSHGAERVAAVRELAEEIGVTIDRQGNAMCSKFSHYSPAAARLIVPFQRWVTPLAEKKRFDTWFFAFATRHDFPEKYKLIPQPGEIEDAVWISPQEALRLHAVKNSGFKMAPPTFIMMHKLAQYQTAIPVVHEHQLALAMQMDKMPRIMPILHWDPFGVFEMHFPNDRMLIHLSEGTHHFSGAFPGHSSRQPKLEPGQEAPDFWRVVVGSPLFDPKTGRPLPQYAAPPADEEVQTSGQDVTGQDVSAAAAAKDGDTKSKL